MTWHAGNMKGAHVVVDAGDVGGLWAARFFCGGGGYLWVMWVVVLIVVEVVIVG